MPPLKEMIEIVRDHRKLTGWMILSVSGLATEVKLVSGGGMYGGRIGALHVYSPDQRDLYKYSHGAVRVNKLPKETVRQIVQFCDAL